MNSVLQQLKQHGIEIRHYIPGRLRFTVSDLRATSGMGEKIASSLGNVPGVTKAEYHPASNSILVTFSANVLSLPENSAFLLTTLQQLFPAVGIGVWKSLWMGKN